MSTGRGRRLRDEESALWRSVTRSIPRLRPQKPSDEPQAAVRTERKALKSSAPDAAKTVTKPAVKPATTARLQPSAPALAPIGRRMKQRLARGHEKIDGRLDLHGRTQAQAHDALYRFLRSAQARGAKNVLVITGKGLRGGDAERGVLKRQVPMWLRLPEFRDLVVGFEDAHIGHGGQGALYVRVRTAK
jgi:DNA-nicking Smr family endonuclease